ncbi:30164_t:CDS:2, partial [Gigaspora margarita]
MDLSCIASSEAASIMNLTLDKKRDLLFNINVSLEIQMGDFDDAWWLLVTNIWTQWNSYKSVGGDISKVFTCYFTKHRETSTCQKENISIKKCRMTKTRPSGLCNTKIKEIERIKRSKAIRTLVKQEVVKNYSPPAITVAIKEYATIELGLGSSAHELKQKEVANIKYKVHRLVESHLVGNSSLKIDFSNSVSYLIEQGYQ